MPEIIRPLDVIEVIDHRETHQAAELFYKAIINIELIGAAATLIFEKFQEKKIDINLNAAILLYCAIFSNTLNLQTNVSARDLEAISILEKESDIPVDIINEMFQYKTEYIENNLEECINNDFKNFDNGLGIAQLEGVDLEKLIIKNEKSIKDILLTLKVEYNLDYVFLTAPDIKNGYNIFVVIDNKTELLLSKSMQLSFNENGIAKNNKLYLRKQILPILINNF